VLGGGEVFELPSRRVCSASRDRFSQRLTVEEGERRGSVRGAPPAWKTDAARAHARMVRPAVRRLARSSMRFALGEHGSRPRRDPGLGFPNVLSRLGMSICAASLAGATKAPPGADRKRRLRRFLSATLPFAGKQGAKKAILWIIVGLVIASFRRARFALRAAAVSSSPPTAPTSQLIPPQALVAGARNGTVTSTAAARPSQASSPWDDGEGPRRRRSPAYDHLEPRAPSTGARRVLRDHLHVIRGEIAPYARGWWTGSRRGRPEPSPRTGRATSVRSRRWRPV